MGSAWRVQTAVDSLGLVERLRLKNVVGRRVTEVIPNIRTSDAELFELYGRVATTGVAERCEYHLNALDQWFQLSVYSSQPEYFAVAFDNITERKQADEQLRLAATAFEVDEAIFITDPRGTILRANASLIRMSGYSMEEVIGNTPKLFRSGRQSKAFYQDMWASLLANGNWRGEIWDRRKNGEIYPKWLTISPVKDAAGQLTHYIASFHELTERKNAEAALMQLNHALTGKKNQLRDLIAQNEVAREDERKHIAREVHDELGQVLTALRMEVSYLSLRFGASDVALNEKVLGMRKLVDAAIQSVRNVVSHLRPSALDMGIYPALEWLCSEFVQRSGVPCTLSSNSESIELDEDRAVAIFRIVQESLTNVSRYANASQVHIAVNCNNTDAKVEIRDNGVGFDPTAITGRKTFGLLGMRERALSMGGDLQTESAPGAGTSIHLRIPIAHSLPRADS